MKFIKNLIIAVLLMLAAFGVFAIYSKYISIAKNNTTESSEILLEKIHTVMKLITVQGTFSEIYNYKDYVLTDSWPFRKSALIRVNAIVSVGYDFENLMINIDEGNKIIRIEKFPEPEIISIEHDLEYYDMKQGLFNVITTQDVTEMSKQAKKFIEQKALNSELFIRAREHKTESERMLSYIFENSGWTLKIMDRPILN